MYPDDMCDLANLHASQTVMGGQWYDANISIPGCDKNMPGVIMAMGRVNRPSLMVYGGTIQAGKAACQGGAQIDIVSGRHLLHGIPLVE